MRVVLTDRPDRLQHIGDDGGGYCYDVAVQLGPTMPAGSRRPWLERSYIDAQGRRTLALDNDTFTTKQLLALADERWIALQRECDRAAMKRDAKAGRGTRLGGRRGAAATHTPERREKTNQKHAIWALHASALRANDLKISDRALAAKIAAKYAGTLNKGAQPTIRKWLRDQRQSQASGSLGPHRSTP